MSLSVSAEDRVAGYAISFSYIGVGLANNDDPAISSAQRGAMNGMFAMNLLGYIPGVSLIVGIARIIFSQVAAFFTSELSKSPKDYGMVKAIQEAQLTRGIIECTMVFEPLLLIADVACTVFFAAMNSDN